VWTEPPGGSGVTARALTGRTLRNWTGWLPDGGLVSGITFGENSPQIINLTEETYYEKSLYDTFEKVYV